MTQPAASPPTPIRRPAPLLVYTCPYCGKLLIRAELRPGSRVEAFCKGCRKRAMFVVPERS